MILAAALLLAAAQAEPPPPQPDEEVVVRARPRDEQGYRLSPIPGAERFERQRAHGLPRAEMKAFGGTLSVEGDSATLAGGQVSKRAMVRLKLPF